MQKEKFEKDLDELIESREKLSEKKSSRKALFKVFEGVFARKAKELWRVASVRFDHTSAQKNQMRSGIENQIERLAALIQWYHFLGDNTLEKIFKNHGITVSIDTMRAIDQELDPALVDPLDWNEAMGESDAGIPNRTQDVMITLLDRTEDLIKDLETFNEDFDSQVEAVANEQDLTKPHVKKAVRIRYKQNNKKEISKDVSKLRSESLSAEQTISVFE